MKINHLNHWSRTPLLPGDSSALVVFSGGQDSTTCLGIAKQLHATVHCIAFSYGQKHSVELDQAAIIANELGVSLSVVDMPILKTMQSSALVNGSEVDREHEYLKGRPASFVPARNALFLASAYGTAMELGARHIYTGVCETDSSGYPDCRHDFIRQLNLAMNIGYESQIEIHTPLMYLDKADTFELARRVGILPEVISLSHTCYNGNHIDPHDWGYGCGTCPACELRAKGWNEFVERYPV